MRVHSELLKDITMAVLGVVIVIILIVALAGCGASGSVSGDVPDTSGTFVVEIEDGEFTVNPYVPSPQPTVTVTATPTETPSASPAATSSPTPTPTPTPTVTPSLGVYDVAPGSNLQAAVNALGNGGGEIVFAPGTYTVSEPLKLPAGNNAPMILSGYGAEIELSNTTPRFLAWDRTASGQVFKNYVVEGFTVDAQGKHPSSGVYSVLGFDDANIGGYHVPQSISIENLTVRDCSVKNVATSPTGAWNACVINVFVSGVGHITDVEIDGCRLEGGQRGINVWAADSTSNVAMDRVEIRNCWHDTMVNPTVFKASTNYHIGQFAHVGTFTIANCYGARSLDCGIEIDQASDGLVSDCVIENSYYNEYYYTNFAAPLVAPGKTVFRDCLARTNISVRGGTGMTIGWEGTRIGSIYLDNFKSELAYGTKVTCQVNSGVVMDGLYVDGAMTSLKRW